MPYYQQAAFKNSLVEEFRSDPEFVKKRLAGFCERLGFGILNERGLNDYVSCLHDIKEKHNTTIGKKFSCLPMAFLQGFQ